MVLIRNDQPRRQDRHGTRDYGKICLLFLKYNTLLSEVSGRRREPDANGAQVQGHIYEKPIYAH